MNLLAQPVSGVAQYHNAHSQTAGKPVDKEVLRVYVERMVEASSENKLNARPVQRVVERVRARSVS
jgi:hypothetical protein